MVAVRRAFAGFEGTPRRRGAERPAVPAACLQSSYLRRHTPPRRTAAMATFYDIIEHVKAHPELWKGNVRSRSYLRDTWTDVAKNLDMDEVILKKRWKHLKDQFRKELKKLQVNQTEDCQWRYYKEMEFMKNELKINEDHNHHNSDREDDTIMESQCSSDSNECQPSTSKKKQKTKKIQKGMLTKRMDKLGARLQSHMDACIQNTKDPDYLYLMSILPFMKKLTVIQKLYFRGRINDWFLETMSQNEFAMDYTETNNFVSSELKEPKGEGI